ncbi:MAG: hypothetical protein RQ756_02940 [Flavobacteriaceae bacterium]|nr:hypothetical protein [Flavobacteriaceae bacterium]
MAANNNLEQQIKTHFDLQEMPVSESLWSNIEQALKKERFNTKRRWAIRVAAVGVFLLSSILFLKNLISTPSQNNSITKISVPEAAIEPQKTLITAIEETKPPQPETSKISIKHKPKITAENIKTQSQDLASLLKEKLNYETQTEAKALEVEAQQLLADVEAEIALEQLEHQKLKEINDLLAAAEALLEHPEDRQIIAQLNPENILAEAEIELSFDKPFSERVIDAIADNLNKAKNFIVQKI